MTLIRKKNSALVKLVEDSRVPEFLASGFELLELPKAEQPPKRAAAKGGGADDKNGRRRSR